MITRKAIDTVLRLCKGFPVVAITGPRQSGKTTLARAVFPEKPYVSLEDPDTRAFADTDPRAFLGRYPDGAILDEVQRCPDLFSYIQTIVDQDQRMGLYILTGSQQFGLRSKITQSLAGRVGMVQLLPFSHGELIDAGLAPAELETAIYTGSYPPLYDREVSPADWHPGYVSTYVERDLHQLIQVRDLKSFHLFLRMCAARTGQLLNLSSLANDCGITHNTAKAWLSVLEASYIVFLLQPHYRNFNKRLIKSPKLYFFDTGLVSWLLGIQEPSQIMIHSLRGALFETWVVAELIKGRLHRGLQPNLYFWRDSTGNEVDVLAEQGERLLPIEIKSGRTVTADYFAGLNKWLQLAADSSGPAHLVYAGDDSQQRARGNVIPWRNISILAEQL
ncbi:MAG: ATP-binding protein [Desulfurivibrionaceae bacterium]|nr:ATP-binding protein [Desulfurivibrionaceae bacterium]